MKTPQSNRRLSHFANLLHTAALRLVLSPKSARFLLALALVQLDTLCAQSGPVVDTLCSINLGVYPAYTYDEEVWLVQASNGTLYGTSKWGGTNHQGALFRVNPDGSDFVILHHFKSGTTDGGRPLGGPPLQANNGNIYGTASVGGSHNAGTAFYVTQQDAYGTLVEFDSATSVGGSTPNGGLVQAPDGSLLGASQSGWYGNDVGQVFRFCLDGSCIPHYVHYFNNGPGDGAGARAGLTHGAGNLFYGTTAYGGQYYSGAVYSMDGYTYGANVYRVLYSFRVVQRLQSIKPPAFGFKRETIWHSGQCIPTKR